MSIAHGHPASGPQVAMIPNVPNWTCPPSRSPDVFSPSSHLPGGRRRTGLPPPVLGATCLRVTLLLGHIIRFNGFEESDGIFHLKPKARHPQSEPLKPTVASEWETPTKTRSSGGCVVWGEKAQTQGCHLLAVGPEARHWLRLSTLTCDWKQPPCIVEDHVPCRGAPCMAPGPGTRDTGVPATWQRPSSATPGLQHPQHGTSLVPSATLQPCRWPEVSRWPSDTR